MLIIIALKIQCGTVSQLRSSLIEMYDNDCVTVIDRDIGHLRLPSSTQQPSNGLHYCVTILLLRPCDLM